MNNTMPNTSPLYTDLRFPSTDRMVPRLSQSPNQMKVLTRTAATADARSVADDDGPAVAASRTAVADGGVVDQLVRTGAAGVDEAAVTQRRCQVEACRRFRRQPRPRRAAGDGGNLALGDAASIDDGADRNRCGGTSRPEIG